MATEERAPNLNDTSLFSPPSKIARLTPDPTPGPIDLPLLSSAEAVTMASPSPLTLGLELGRNGSNSASSLARKPIFTFMQMQELEHQALIYKYMAGSLPVPLHLVLPIWKSVAAATNCDGHHHHSFLGCGGLCLDYRNSLEPEPGRCRRTDGKKWRCARAIVPNQKYCERHMHRGRNRSRKPAEAGMSGSGSGGNGFDDLMPAVPLP